LLRISEAGEKFSNALNSIIRDIYPDADLTRYSQDKLRDFLFKKIHEFGADHPIIKAMSEYENAFVDWDKKGRPAKKNPMPDKYKALKAKN
jgi:uncharacterized protein (DUF2267 family)